MLEMPSIIASAIIGLVAGADPSPALAHEFTVAIVGDGLADDPVTHVAEAVRGFIVATRENDGHAFETSDGHLGGLDVQIWVLPPGGAAAVAELVGSPAETADIALLLGPVPSAMGIGDAALGLATIFVRPAALPSPDLRAASGFAGRFRAQFGHEASEAAEQGYNAARRIDRAIRASGDLDLRATIRAALSKTERGMDW
ncbi:hypothetical protein [Pararhizobium sp. IMCC21322]|uniref:hypothetical protein n=1 Tax=Pararhizobium sp. IMCC21322 TaxID=3067903 RepID=UPI002741A11B|nr:hypothetical protein [Pararhizobium sp. IMCC21322]